MLVPRPARTARRLAIHLLHLEEIVDGKPSTLPKSELYLNTEQDTVAVSSSSPQSVQVTIKGPFPQPKGAFGCAAG